MEQNEQKILKGVKGNPLSLAIPLQKVTFTPNGKVTEDYYPAEGSVVEVMLLGAYQRFTYEPVVEGNMVRITDKGTLPVGEYAVVTTVTEPDGTPRRSKWCNIVRIYDCTDAVLEEYEDFPEYGESEVLDGTVFIFAKGDPFTYDDFTEEQLADLKRPAEEAAATARLAAGVANQASREARGAAQDATDAASAANGATADAQQAAAAANTAATNANNAADSAEEAAIIGGHPDYVGEDNYVYKYNMRDDRYEKTNIYVKGDKGDAGTTDYNLLENKPTRVSQFENDADYATESFVNSSIATATATYRGSYNLVTDLGLSVGASAADVSAALATSISDADNNDYCFVKVPVATDTPTVIARIDRYKHNGSGWLYEYTLNNSGFTAEQWDAINSGITSGDVDKLDALPTNAQLTSLLNGKQDTINDLGTIRSGASAGATAYQKPESGIPESDLSQEVKDKMNEKEVFWAEYGTTTAAEIDAAVAAGKEVLCLKDNRVYQLAINASNLTYIQFFTMLDTSVSYLRLKRSNNAWDSTTNSFQKTSDRVNSWQATPDNTHYPSEKLVKESLDAKAGIGDVLFANFSNLTPKKTFEYDVSDTAYHPLFSRANTGISQLMSEVDDIVKFRITVTGTNIYARVDVLVRFQPALTYPCIMAWNDTYGTTAGTTGIYFLRGVNPKTLNSGYDFVVEFRNYNNTTRHIKVEVYEDTENITWIEENTATSYDSTYQDYNGIQIYTNRGLCANQTWRLENAFANNSSTANYLNGYFNIWVAAGMIPYAGEALAGNQLAIMSEQKVYKATNKNVPIDCDCGVILMGAAVSADNSVGYVNYRQKITWPALTADPALTMDTFARGDQVYLRCTLGQDGKIYPDGHLSNVKSAGYTWVHIGTAASATAINLDTCGKPFITLNNDGKVTHINGTAVMDSSMSKWGVVSQTQTWPQASDGGYDYTMSNLQYGWIPQANIDLYEAAGAVFNEQSGYFELNGLTDISYEEMKDVYEAPRATMIPNGLTRLFQSAQVRTTIPYKTNNNYGGLGSLGAVSTCNVSNLEVLAISKKHDGTEGDLNVNGMNYFAANSYRLKKIIGRIWTAASKGSQDFNSAFTSCKSLEEIHLFRIGKDITFGSSPRLKTECIAEMINNCINETFTITLHPTAYARAIADSDVQAALQAHTNVSLASAT